MRRGKVWFRQSRKRNMPPGGATRQMSRRDRSNPAMQALRRCLEDEVFCWEESGAFISYTRAKAACLRDWMFVWDILEGGGSVYEGELGHWAAALLRDFCLLVWLAGEDLQNIADALLEK